MTKAFANCFVKPQYFPWYIQALVVFLFTRHHFIIYITCLCIVDCFGSWLALLCLCYCFDIALSIYDLFSVQRGQCACKYTHPIILSLFVCQLSCLRGIDVELVGGKGLIVLYGFLFFFEGDLRARTHTHTHLCRQTRFRREKLYLNLHKNNWHFKLAFQSKRIIFSAYVQLLSTAMVENMKGRAKSVGTGGGTS